MQCPRCSANVPPDAARCPVCGTSAAASSDPDATLAAPAGDPTVAREATRATSGAGPGPTPPAPALPLQAQASISAGRLLGSRYRIERLLGAGGMGAVYRAQDLELEIPVAVKVIRPEIIGDTAGGREFSRRFKQELLLARQVTHQNVLRIHDLGEAEGLRYITMPFVEGRDLAHVLHDGPMAIERVLRFARQVASGLAAAHDAGVVHRDLKPHNILIDKSDTAYISDFGLAKSLDTSTAGVTQPGEFLGTPRYAAPEQVEGQPVDNRTDIYALGLILYEMVAGEVPFTGTSLVEILMKRVRDVPRDLREVKPEVPESLARIVMRCLERDPAARYQSSHEIVADLDADRATVAPVTSTARSILSTTRGRRRGAVLAAGGVVLLLAAVIVGTWVGSRPTGAGAGRVSTTPAVPPLSEGRFLAVMPFRILGDPTGVDYVAEGLSESLSARLFQLGGLKVTPSASVREAGVKDTPEKTAQALGVNLIVEGIVQAAGDQIRVIVNLQDIHAARRVWSQQFTGVARDLFALEDQVYSQLLHALQVSPDASEAARTASLRTSDVDAYDDYLRGRKALRGAKERESGEAAVRYFESALKKDPTFALAQAGLADAALLMYRETKDSFWSQRALAAATRASDLNDQLSEVQMSLGNVYLATGRNSEALVAMRRALEIAPNSDEAFRRLGRAYLQAGKHPQAIEAFKKAIGVNPYFWLNENVLGQAYLDSGDYERALGSFRRVTQLEPDNPTGYENIGTAYFTQGRWEECVPAYEKALALQPYYLTYSNLGTAQFFLKRYDQAVATFEKAVSLHPNDAITVGNLADALRWSSQKDRARPTYEKAIALAYKELQVNPRDATTLAMLALYYAKTGDESNATEFVKRARAVNRTDPGLIYAEAVVNSLVGRRREALDSLEEAFRGGYSPREAENDPELAPIAASPEFRALARKYSRSPR